MALVYAHSPSHVGGSWLEPFAGFDSGGFDELDLQLAVLGGLPGGADTDSESQPLSADPTPPCPPPRLAIDAGRTLRCVDSSHASPCAWCARGG